LALVAGVLGWSPELAFEGSAIVLAIGFAAFVTCFGEEAAAATGWVGGAGDAAAFATGTERTAFESGAAFASLLRAGLLEGVAAPAAGLAGTTTRGAASAASAAFRVFTVFGEGVVCCAATGCAVTGWGGTCGFSAAAAAVHMPAPARQPRTRRFIAFPRIPSGRGAGKLWP
jgi:hypothetical protein